MTGVCIQTINSTIVKTESWKSREAPNDYLWLVDALFSINNGPIKLLKQHWKFKLVTCSVYLLLLTENQKIA